jgi:hypothetical protein
VEVLLVVVLGRRVAAALLGEDVDDDRALRRQLDGVAEGVLERLDVVTVDRTDVPDAERLEERRWLEELADAAFTASIARSAWVPTTGRPCRNSSRRRWRRTYTGLSRMSVSTFVGEPCRSSLSGMLGCSTSSRPTVPQVRHRRRVAAAVVVEHDDDPTLRVAEVVERLVGHAAGHRPVADDGDDVAVVVDAGVAGDGHAVRVRQHVDAWLFSTRSWRLSSRLG